ncbi:Sec1-like protein [Polychaeton citri CBS 116435]|uniref:Sec1-like protein n=1 Tax=Polychaeton citri CBS 116435 TaxID=1314669 RepID=A0A9P4UR04_9PEZI|nr:Sec1-like protein [Polychaeton citri CBS 116435]
MGVSIIDAQRDILLHNIKHTTRGDWKLLVLDTDSRRLIDNVLDEDTILNENITNIEQIEHRRPTNRDVEAVYILTPQPHIVDCVMADFEKRKYKRAHLIWTALLHPALRDRIDRSHVAREQIALFKVLNVEFYPRESHLVTFRDPWGFPVLFHPACNSLVRQYMEDIAQKIVGVCVALGEYPVIRYYRPPRASHEASILCSHLARFVQDELDLYAKFHEDFPPQTSRPRGALYITDRTMDLVAPCVHEFTYQAMAHDLLPIKEGDKIMYRVVLNEGAPNQEVKDVEIREKDNIWTENRHKHMKDVIDKLMADFERFIKDNPNFTQQDAQTQGANGLNVIKDMLAGLPQFQEMKEAYGLHLGMAQESMNRFQKFRLPDLASVEQNLATGLDEEYKKPKGLADQVVRMLDDDAILPSDRLRLLILYLLYKDGLVPGDLQKLIAHANFSSQDEQTIRNFELLGAHTSRQLKDPRPPPTPLFLQKTPPAGMQEEYALSRFEPVLQNVLEAHHNNTLDPNTFAYTKPPLDMGIESNPAAAQSTASLRSAKPTWAKTRSTGSSNTHNRQRVIVFMAGGATFSESRACYSVGQATGREVFLISSHMLNPQLFLKQVADLSADRRRLDIPSERPKPQAPRHLFEPDEVPKPPPQQQPVQQLRQQQQQQPVQQMGAMSLGNSGAGRPSGGSSSAPAQPNSSAKLEKKEKKKHHFFSSKKHDK